MNIFEIDREFQEILGALEVIDVSEEPDRAKELLAELEALSASAESKVTNCVKFIKYEELRASQTRGHISALSEEAKGLRATEASAINRSKWMRRAVSSLLTTIGKSIRTSVGTVSLLESKSVEILDESLVPEDYFRIKKEVDKEKALRDLKSGKQIEGLSLKTETSINIR